MKITLDKIDVEDLEEQNFVKFKSKKQKLTGKQTVTQLVTHTENDSDPSSKFTNPDLHKLAKMGFLDELIAGIKTGKEGSVFLGRNSRGFVAVKVYTDLRVRSFKRDESYREGRFIGDSRMERAIEQGSEKGRDAHQILWVQELPWDQRAFWATTVGTEIAGSIPVIGDLALVFLRVGWSVSDLTLSPFYGLHVIVLPISVLAMMGLHFIMIRRQGIAKPL